MKRTADLRTDAVARRAFKGIVRANTVVLGDTAEFPDGTKVLVTPLVARAGSPPAVLAAMAAPPDIATDAVDELMRCIEAAKRSVRFGDPLSSERST